MLPLFNLVRFVIYGTVFAWTIIVLGVAAFLEHILVSSDLTRFVPLALFVASTTILALSAMLIFGALKSSTIISQTRSEMSCIGLLGILWLSLGAYTSTQEVADVECDDDFSYDSSTYHAQYHVLQAFSIFNTILLWSFFLFFAFCALRHHFAGRREAWTSKAVEYPWFGPAKTIAAQQKNRSRSKSEKSAGLPLPVTTKDKSSSKKQTSSSEKPAPAKPSRSNYQPRRANDGPTVVQPAAPPKAAQPGESGHTYVVFIPPSGGSRQQKQQIYPQRK